MSTALGQATLPVISKIDDYAEFSAYPDAVQSRVLNRLDWMEQIENAGWGKKDFVVKAAAIALGVEECSIHRYASRYRNRGWRGLLDGRGKASASKGLPALFQQEVRALHAKHVRDSTGREVWKKLVERWQRWARTGDPKHAIPGYDFPPPATRRGYPFGWSEDSIVRLRPDGYTLTAARRGEKAAADFLPSILKTRLGMRFGEVVFFDDQDYDNKIAAPGLSQQALRPQGFNALEYLSATFAEWCIRLRWFDVDKDQYRTLTVQDATWFALTYLLKHGYRTDVGSTLVMEHGTMKGFANEKLNTPGGEHSLKAALKAVLKGKVQIAESGLFNSPVFAGMLFRPQSSGNPNFKAPLEGIFNLLRNRMDGLTGPTGRHRDLKPSEQYGQDLYVKQLLKLWDTLDDSHRALLRFPMMTPQQFGTATMAVYRAINARTDHALQGWAECGFQVPQVRMSLQDRWISQHELATYPEDAQGFALAMMKVPGHCRVANLAPIDVADMFRHELTKLPLHLIPLLVPVEWARKGVVNESREVVISDQLLGPESFKYTARIEHSDSATVLKPGTVLRCYLNPHMPDLLVVCRQDGGYIGALTRTGRVGWLDDDGIIEQLEERAKLKADLDAGVRPLLEGQMKARAEMESINKTLREGKPATAEEKTAANSERGKRAARTKRDRDIAAAIGKEGMDLSNLMPREVDAEPLQEPCKPGFDPFDISQLLNRGE